MGSNRLKKSPVHVEFAKKVRNRRYELGLTQEELAERADLHVNYSGGIERVRNSFQKSIQICYYLSK